jgi:hypothetical protein
VHQLFEAVAQRTPVPLALEDARARALNGHRAALLGIHEATGRMRVSSM